MWLKVISLFLSGFGLGVAITNYIWYNASMEEMERRRKARESNYKRVDSGCSVYGGNHDWND